MEYDSCKFFNRKKIVAKSDFIEFQFFNKSYLRELELKLEGQFKGFA